jgi:hypothetical protein
MAIPAVPAGDRPEVRAAEEVGDPVGDVELADRVADRRVQRADQDQDRDQAERRRRGLAETQAHGHPEHGRAHWSSSA